MNIFHAVAYDVKDLHTAIYDFELNHVILEVPKLSASNIKQSAATLDTAIVAALS